MTAAALTLSLSCWDYDRTRRLLDGQIRVPGITLHALTHAPEETFFRMLKWQEFDVAEMSLSSYVMTLFDESSPFVAIPVFPSRAFRHGGIYVRGDSPLTDPAALVGTTVGVPEYQMTASVWIRGILADRHGVPADSVAYRTGGLRDAGRSEKIQLRLPPAFDVRPIGAGRTLEAALLGGELDALYSARAPSAFHPEGHSANSVRRLFSDPMSAEQEYYEATRIFPIMHTVVIRRAVYEAHPWIARALFDAFVAARDAAYAELDEVTALKHMLPWGVQQHERVRQLMGNDFWAYGLEPNEHVLRTFLRYSHEQGLSPRAMEPEELFVPETHSSTLI
jgi:4,5-dihydroxyphthalate decarboxylase